MLSELGGQVYAPQLDRADPLWKMTLLRGLPDGTTPIIWKVHHAMVDGVSGVDFMMVMNDLSPDSTPSSAVAPSWQPRLFQI